jgi:hypothetical protein
MNYLILAMIVILVAVAAWIRGEHKTAKFNERFPPIDDDEFVRRCGPGVNRDTAIRVRRIISEQLGIEYERVYPEQSFANDLECD